MKLRPEVKEKWLAALRGGEYRQGLGRLRVKVDAFCCLGVLCDLARKDGVGHWVEAEDGYRFQTSQSARDLIPFDVVDWAYGPEAEHNLHCMDPRVPSNGSTTLSYLNDQNTPFSKIADVIEEYL